MCIARPMASFPCESIRSGRPLATAVPPDPPRPLPVPQADELYLARGHFTSVDGVPLTVPYRQGDVFQGVPLPGFDAPEGGHTVMLFMHPCTMRSGPSLQDWVSVIRVRKFGKGSRKDADRWEEGNFSEIPLRGLESNRAIFVADMGAIFTVASSQIPRTRRIASLTDSGMLAVQHRLIYHLTRLSIPYTELRQANRGLLAELEMQHGWVALAVPSSGVPDLEQIQAAEEEFDVFLTCNGRRDRLRDTATGEPQVRKEFNDACLKRFGSLPG